MPPLYGDVLEIEDTEKAKHKHTKPKAIRTNVQKRKADTFEVSDDDSNDTGEKRKNCDLFLSIILNKLGLSWAKLSSSWDYALLQL